MTKQQPLDPLYTIFEQHLYNFEDSEQDRKTFIAGVLKDYLGFLRKLSICIPQSLESLVIDELAIQVNTMLVKKIYGCLSIDDYRKKAKGAMKRRARGRYDRMNKAAKSAPAAAASPAAGTLLRTKAG